MRQAAIRGSSMLSTDHDNLDPFLDIVSNVVGILIVVAVLIAVSVSVATTTVYAPLLYEPPSELSWGDEFLCLDQRVAFVESREILSQLEQFSKKQYGSGWNCDLGGISQTWQKWIANKEQFHGEHFCIGDFFWNESSQCAFFSISLMPENRADDLKQLRSEKSRFREFLATKDPAMDGITLIAAPSGFREFQVARDIAKSAGFHVEVRIAPNENLYWTLYGQFTDQDVDKQQPADRDVQ